MTVHSTPTPTTLNAIASGSGSGSGSNTGSVARNLRPTPPGRSKRHSLTPTSRANIAASLDTSAASYSRDRDRESADQKPLESPRAGVIAGLRERVEEDVGRASKGEIEVVLREQWDARDRMIARTEQMEVERKKLERERVELIQSLGGMQSRVDEAFNEQGRLEADLEGRDQILERIRARMNEAEKSLRDNKKRYAEQEKSFEAEREAFRAQEAHLQSRIHTLSSKSKSSNSNSADETEALQEELASLSAAHCTLVAQFNTTSKEVMELKESNKRLEEENSGWELLMRERTMSGTVRGRGLLSEEWLESDLDDDEEEDEGMMGGTTSRKGPITPERSVRRKGKSVLESLDEEMEAELGDAGYAVPIDEGQGMGTMGSGGDLAAELGRAGADVSTAITPVSGESEALRAEIKSLKDANKALSLYCSKIIDRIIAQEGFEHVLSVDYKTRRARSHADLGKGPQPKTRASVHDVVQAMHEESGETRDARSSSGTKTIPQVMATAPTPKKEPPVASAVAEKKKARPLSMMVRGWSSGAEKEKEAESELGKVGGRVSPLPMETKEEAKKEEKRAKRGFSIDFRSFGFGSSTPSPSPVEQPKGLKPLTLPQRAVSQSSITNSSRATSPGAVSPIESSARKLAVTAEDEEDRKERHRMEAAMRLMGIDRTQSTSPSHFEILDDDPLLTAREFGSANTSTSPRMTGTPLSRLSSALSHSSRSPTLELQDPTAAITDDAALAALKAFDEKEKAQAKALAKGKATTEYTTPSKIGQGRRRLSARRSGSEESPSPGKHLYRRSEESPGVPWGGPAGAGAGQTARTMRTVSKSESISTLFSAGSDSRPGSVDLGKGN